MSIQELKSKLHELVEQSSNEEELNYVYKLLSDNEEGDFWLTLSEEEKIEIEKGLEDIRMGRVVSHEDAMKRIAKWR
jgi:predicted transcriptional regulator